MEGLLANKHIPKQRLSPHKSLGTVSHLSNKQNQVGTVMLYGIPIVSLVIESQERLCLAQISNTLLKQYSYNEIHNRRVALGITCVQCTPVQLEILRRAGAMPVSSRRCGMITRREAERLCKSFLGDNAPPRLPDDFAFSVHHECAWGCRGAFLPSRYNSSRAKCIKCTFCGLFFSPNKFIFHSHRTSPNAAYVQPDAANFNSWRRHMKLSGSPPDDIVHAWEDVKAMFNGGTRKRLLTSSGSSSIPLRPSVPSSVPITIAPPMPKQVKVDSSTTSQASYSPSNTIPTSLPTTPRVPPFPDLTLPISMIDYVWHNGVNAEGIKQFPFTPYAVPWFGNARRSVLGLSCLPSMSSQQESLLQHLCPPNSSDKIYHHSAFRPVFPALGRPDVLVSPDVQNNNSKRPVSSEEILLPKKKYSREVEKASSFSTMTDLNEDDKSSCRSIELPSCESFNKENDFKKGAGKSDPQSLYPETHTSGSPQNGNIKMTFKKEFNSETSDDSDELPKFATSKYKGQQQESKELLDVSKLLTLKPAILDENILKFREFSPNIIEAITGLKAEDRGMPIYSGIHIKNYAIGGDDKTAVALEDCNKRKEFSLIDDASESDTRSEKDEDDEPVDVESTDDVPVDKRPSCRSQEICDMEKPATKILEEEERPRASSPGEMKPHKIWTIARFSVGEQETDSVTPQPTVEKSTIYKNHNSEIGNIKGSLPELKNKRNDCFNCWQVTVEKGEIK